MSAVSRLLAKAAADDADRIGQVRSSAKPNRQRWSMKAFLLARQMMNRRGMAAQLQSGSVTPSHHLIGVLGAKQPLNSWARVTPPCRWWVASGVGTSTRARSVLPTSVQTMGENKAPHPQLFVNFVVQAGLQLRRLGVVVAALVITAAHGSQRQLRVIARLLPVARVLLQSVVACHKPGHMFPSGICSLGHVSNGEVHRRCLRSARDAKHRCLPTGTKPPLLAVAPSAYSACCMCQLGLRSHLEPDATHVNGMPELSQ